MGVTMNYPEPWQHEPIDALEISVLGLPVAWTADDDVFVRTGDTAEREDGYVHIGLLGWEDTDDPCDDAGYNTERLRQYVLAWIKANPLSIPERS